MKKKILIILLTFIVIAAIGVGVYFGIIKNNGKENKEEEKINWGEEYTVYLKDSEEENVQIGLIDINFDDIPELILKTANELYKILYIDQESKEVKVAVEDKIEKIDLVYDDKNQKYSYVYTKSTSPKTVNIIQDNFETIKDVDSTTDEYIINYITIKEDLQENLINEESINTKNEDETQEFIENLEQSYKTTNDLVEDANVDIAAKIEEIKAELSQKLSEEEAIETGRELFIWGIKGPEGDFSTYKNAGMMSGTESLKDPNEVTDHMTENMIAKKETTDMEDYYPWKLVKSGDTWLVLSGNLGSHGDYIGVKLEVTSLTSSRIEFEATEYFFEDYNEFEKSLEDNFTYDTYGMNESDLDKAISKYKTKTETSVFVIVKEDGKWKIDQQETAW